MINYTIVCVNEFARKYHGSNTKIDSINLAMYRNTIDQGLEYDEAMNKFYHSEVFEKLQDTGKGLYSQSPAYVYDLFKDEMNFGHIVQAEI